MQLELWQFGLAVAAGMMLSATGIHKLADIIVEVIMGAANEET